MKNILFTVCLILSISSCKTHNLFQEGRKETIRYQHEVFDSVFMFNPNYSYTIQRGNKISVSIWKHPNFSIGSIYNVNNSSESYGNWALVDQDGMISLPKVGSYKIQGQTVLEAKRNLGKLYSKWIVKPIIDVKILNKQVSILGELRNPGKYIIDRDVNSLFDIVSLAGGFEQYANKMAIKVIRQKGNQVKMINVDLTKPDQYLNRNIQIYPGDLVVVPSKKAKDFETRISSIIPIATSITSAAILVGAIL